MRTKRQLVALAHRWYALGLGVNCSGNFSLRETVDGVDGFWITPTGMPYESLVEDDFVWVAMDGERPIFVGKRRPSSEWLMHRRAYRARPRAQAVVHTHSMYATALACRGMGIPSFHYMVAKAGATTIPCLPYATFGTPRLAQTVRVGLQNVKAALLSHHGVIATEVTLDKAVRLAVEVEFLAQQYAIVCQLGGPQLIDSEEMGRILQKFATYGQQKPKEE